MLKTNVSYWMKLLISIQAEFKKHPKSWEYESRTIDRMIMYLAKHSFFPESYQRLLNFWTLKLSEEDAEIKKMLADLLAGEKIDMSPIKQVEATFKKAEKFKREKAEQLKLSEETDK